MKKLILFLVLSLFSCTIFASIRHVTVTNTSDYPITVSWTAWGCFGTHNFGGKVWTQICKRETLNPKQSYRYKFKWGTHSRMIFIDHQVGHNAYVCKQMCHPHSQNNIDNQMVKGMRDRCDRNRCDF